MSLLPLNGSNWQAPVCEKEKTEMSCKFGWEKSGISNRSWQLESSKGYREGVWCKFSTTMDLVLNIFHLNLSREEISFQTRNSVVISDAGFERSTKTNMEKPMFSKARVSLGGCKWGLQVNKTGSDGGLVWSPACDPFSDPSNSLEAPSAPPS